MKLEKSIWTNEDFSEMGWHDSKIWGFLPNTDKWEYLVDLDYIYKWVHPEGDEEYFKFWVSPVTLVFENASDVIYDIESDQGEIEILDLQREKLGLTPNGKLVNYRYKFDCREGLISVEATGFKQYTRRKPVLINSQCLSLEQRGGVCFDKVEDLYQIDIQRKNLP